MDAVETLIIGAGVSGLATAGALAGSDYLVLEAEPEIGGYCKTIRRDGFTWDYSGHFFHFKRPEIEAWLRERMPGQRVLTVDKRAFVAWRGGRIDFPFQKNIHQLPRDEFIDCLHDLYFARAPRETLGRHAPPAAAPEENFREMLYARFGRSIAEKFLVPYNEKLYACDLATLDKDAMGRFFPHADLTDVIRNMRHPDNASYNATFTYPEGGAIEYVRALATAVAPERIRLDEPLLALDLAARVATTSRRRIAYRRLVSSAPFPRLLRMAGPMAGIDHDPADFSWNKVLVYNLGFDRKGPEDVHWMYFPERDCCFYRIGFYDNIFQTTRLSAYVEIGLAASDAVDVERTLERVLRDMGNKGVIDGHRLVAWHSVVMDPAYVHITRRSIAEHARLAAQLAAHDVHPIGRYGGWTYCSIEDNIVEARALVERLQG